MKTLHWYIVSGIAAIIAYPFAVKLLSQQFSVYQIHMGNPASYIVIFALVGLYVERYAKRKWGKMNIKGYALLVVALFLVYAILTKLLGYKFF